MGNLEKYNDIFKNLFEVQDSDLNGDFNFGKAKNWDSFAHMDLVADLEEAIDIMLDADDITHFGGYENGKAVLRKYGVEL